MIGILIVAHAPLASALRQCVLHVFPDAGGHVSALDVPPNQPPSETLARTRWLAIWPMAVVTMTPDTGAPAAGGRQGRQLHVVPVQKGLGHDSSSPCPSRLSPCSC